jgi:hypothetical protein
MRYASLSILFFCFPAIANAAAPTAYKLVQVNAFFGPPIEITTIRDGDKVVAERPSQSGGRLRTYYDLKAGLTYTWDPAQTSPECGFAHFSGDWGDPFGGDLAGEIAKLPSKAGGKETLNGFATKIVEAVDPKSGAKFKIWSEEKSGMLIKLEMPDATGATHTAIETKSLRLGKQATGIFALPVSCVKAAAAPQPMTDAQRIDAETGGHGADYVMASIGPASAKTCAIRVRVVQEKTLQAVTHFQLAIDGKYDVEHPPHYVIGVGTDGHLTFSGGDLHEVTAQLQNGVYHLANAPAQFSIELGLGKAGSGGYSTFAYRQCFGAESELLAVIRGDDVDWLWSKK